MRYILIYIPNFHKVKLKFHIKLGKLTKVTLDSLVKGEFNTPHVVNLCHTGFSAIFSKCYCLLLGKI